MLAGLCRTHCRRAPHDADTGHLSEEERRDASEDDGLSGVQPQALYPLDPVHSQLERISRVEFALPRPSLAHLPGLRVRQKTRRAR